MEARCDNEVLLLGQRPLGKFKGLRVGAGTCLDMSWISDGTLIQHDAFDILGVEWTILSPAMVIPVKV